MGENKLSVIMPVYNVAEFVEKAVESVMQQTYKNLELVLVDDGSTDGSSEICQRLADSDSRIKLIRKENQGVSAARNDGLSIATGEYITFADSDDWVDPNAYEKMMDYLLETKTDICVMGYTAEGDKSFVSRLKKENKQILSRTEAVSKLIEGKVYTWSIWDKIYRRGLLTNIEFNKDIVNGEDLLFNWQVFRKVANVAYIPLHGYHYVQRITSMTNTFSQKKMSVMKAFDYILCECEDEPQLSDKITEKYISVLISLINCYWGNCDKFRPKYEFQELYSAKAYLQSKRMKIMFSRISVKEKVCAILIMQPIIITSIVIRSYYYIKRLMCQKN